ncbi:MAG: enamine deaminase RidA (YjgF/YER057c/UK114 family) [Paracoccaceae bacterium]|jgi:enamine deaminase RidA (YjgF/YER057c/UK114 family)
MRLVVECQTVDKGRTDTPERETNMSITHINPSERMSQATVHNGVAYLAGQIAVDAPGASAEAQTRNILARIDALLAEVGSDKSRMLSATIYLADIGEFGEMNAVWDAWVEGMAPPARATVEAKLATPDYIVEIVVVATCG